MNIKITGINGYLGKLISKELIERGHNVSGIKRNLLYDSVSMLREEIKGCDVIINLAGAPILRRWTKKNKLAILNSRVKSTMNLVEAINSLPTEEQPNKFISASAIGIYKPGFQHTETSTNFDNGFVGEVVKKWEAVSQNLPSTVQRNIFRIGIVLGKNAKTITHLLLPFKLGLGATIGNGKQAFPFVHETDVANAFLWVVEECNNSETYNLVAPENISNRAFTQTLAKEMHRPAFLFIPELILKIVFGEAAILLTKGAQVEPLNLINAGFRFQYPGIEEALREILS